MEGFGALSLFEGRRDLSLFKHHWKGSQLRERLTQKKDSLFFQQTERLGILRCWVFRSDQNRPKALLSQSLCSAGEVRV